MIKNLRFPKMLLIFALLLGTSSLVIAQTDYPNRPVKVIAPQATGGGVDIVGRFMSDKMRQAMGQSFIIDNQAGAGGAIAAKLTMRAPADGYTLMIGYVATHGTNPAVKKNIYDSVKDFTPIAMFGGTPNVIVVAKGVPVKNLKELVAYSKKQPLNYGTSGIGTLNHLLMEQFKFAASMPALMVPYKSIGQAFTDSVGGSIQVIFPGLSAAMPHIRNGTLIPLAVTGNTRSSLLPDTPTFKESGFEGFEGLTWYGLVGPAKLPEDIKKKINSEVNKLLAQADVKKFFVEQALTPMPMSPEQFEDYMTKEVVHWTKVAKDSNITAE